MDNCIDLNKFIKKFYEINEQTDIFLEVLTMDKSNPETNIYDIHHILINILVAGLKNCNLTNVKYIEVAISLLQKYFSNIKINIIFEKKTISDILSSKVDYYNQRYARIDLQKIIDADYKITDKDYIVLNGQHQNVNELSEIHTFINIGDEIFYKLSFDHMEVKQPIQPPPLN